MAKLHLFTVSLHGKDQRNLRRAGAPATSCPPHAHRTPLFAVLTAFPLSSEAGNSVSARRIARRLQSAGIPSVAVEGAVPPDATGLIAINAWRLSDAVHAFVGSRPDCPVIAVLAGSDLYGDGAGRAREATGRCMAEADALVVVQPAAIAAVPPGFRAKCHVIAKSVDVSGVPQMPRAGGRLDAVVLSHLRAAKDPLLAAHAVEALPESSRVRVVHYGMALDDALAAEARLLTEKTGGRYRWAGEVPHHDALAATAAAGVFINSSRFEGGANALCEAIALGTPVLATRIPGNTGFLGDDYPGWFPCGDAAALASLLHRCETSPAFLGELREQCNRQAPLFAPERESARWAALIGSLVPGSRG